MDNINKLFGQKDEEIIAFLNQMEQYDTIFTGISREIGMGLTGTQVISFLESLGVGKQYVDMARLSVVSESSFKNVDAFYDCFRLHPENKLFNINIVADPIKFLTGLNSVIKNTINCFFDVLNKSTDDNRFHKAICLRRDIKRMECITRFGPMPKTFKKIAWEKIDIEEDYIDGEVSLDFLDEEIKRYFEWIDPMKFWHKSDLCYCLTSQIRYRQEFLARLLVFGIDIPAPAGE